MSGRKLKVWIPKEPTSKERPRCSCKPAGPRCGACGQQRKVPHVHSGSKSNAWEQEVADLLRPLLPSGGPFRGPLRVRMEFVKPRPKSRPKPSSERVAAGDFYVPADVWKLGNRCYAPSRPDYDNYEKALLDAIGMSGLIHDDAQFVDAHPSKWFAAVDEEPGISLFIGEIY